MLTSDELKAGTVVTALNADKAAFLADCGNYPTLNFETVKAHKEVVVKGKEETCTEDGISDSSYCSECNAVIKAQEVIPAGHSLKWIVDKKATVKKSGSRHQECSRCGEKIEGSEEVLPILPYGVALSKVVGGKKKLTAKWSKPSKAKLKTISGYEIAYATNSSFSDIQVKKVSKTKTALTVSRLKAKKTYYVKIRTYRKSADGIGYASWSKAKKIKTK